MARITIVGSGVIGMAIASQLSRAHDIITISRDPPGDEPTIDWVSPWAGANFIAGGVGSVAEANMQLDAFTELWRWSRAHPESSIRRITLEDYHDDKTEDDIWWKDFMPEFRFLPKNQLPEGAALNTSFTTIVLNVNVFFPWLRQRLEKSGVKFERYSLNAISDVSSRPHDVLINATGTGSKFLTDINDKRLQQIRGQTILVKHDYGKCFMHDNSQDYTYVIPRLDGAVILGGVRQVGNTTSIVPARTYHKHSHLSDYHIIKHNVGIRTGRSGGPRVEKEIRNGQKIVHCYGFGGGCYIHGFGAGRSVSKLVDGFPFLNVLAKLH